jgi:hypothetical protein
MVMIQAKISKRNATIVIFAGLFNSAVGIYVDLVWSLEFRCFQAQTTQIEYYELILRRHSEESMAVANLKNRNSLI